MEHENTHLDKASVVKEFWAAPDEALVDQKVMEAVTGLSSAFFERARWAGKGPPYIKIAGRVRYVKGSIARWINPSVTSETPRPVVAAPKARKKPGQPRGNGKQKARPGSKRERRTAERRVVSKATPPQVGG
jgi:hypothetical protein